MGPETNDDGMQAAVEHRKAATVVDKRFYDAAGLKYEGSDEGVNVWARLNPELTEVQESRINYGVGSWGLYGEEVSQALKGKPNLDEAYREIMDKREHDEKFKHNTLEVVTGGEMLLPVDKDGVERGPVFFAPTVVHLITKDLKLPIASFTFVGDGNDGSRLASYHMATEEEAKRVFVEKVSNIKRVAALKKDIEAK